MNDMSLQALLGATEAVTDALLTQTYPKLAAAVEAPVYLLAVLYWSLSGYRIYAGYAALRWDAVLSRIFMTFAAFGMLNWGGLAQQLYRAFAASMDGMVTMLATGTPTLQRLDALHHSVDLVSSALRSSDSSATAIILDGFLLHGLNSLLFVLVLAYLTIARAGLAITMLLAPVFIGFLLFPAARQWFVNWVSAMLTCALSYILVIAILRFGFSIFGDTLDGLAATDNGSQKTGQLIVVEGVLVFFLLHVGKWAARLAGGTAQQGITVVMSGWLPQDRGSRR